MSARARAIRLFARAKRHQSDWQLSKALSAVERAQRISDASSLDLLKVRILIPMGRTSEARDIVRAFLKEDPGSSAAINLASVLGLRPGDLNERSKETFDSPSEFVKHAKGLLTGGRASDLIRSYEKGVNFGELSSRSEREQLLYTMATAYEMARFYDKAIGLYEQAIECSHNEERSRIGIANCLFYLGRYGDARSYLAEHLHGSQEFIESRFFLDVIDGDLRSAFKRYRRAESAAELKKVFGNKYPEDANVIFHKSRSAIFLAQAGIGDEIDWAQIYPDIYENIGKVVITCEPRLYALFNRSFPDVKFVPVKRFRSQLPFDAYSERDRIKSEHVAQYTDNRILDLARGVDFVCPVREAAYRFRPNRAAFYGGPKLKADPHLSLLWKQRIHAETESKRRLLHVVLSWRSLVLTTKRNKNHVDVEDLLPLGDLERVQFWICQPGLTQEERQYIDERLPFAKVPEFDHTDDIEQLAAFFGNMDLCVSPGSANAAISAALGVRTLIFLNSPRQVWIADDEGRAFFWPDFQRVILAEPWGNCEDIIQKIAREIRDLQRADPQTVGWSGVG